MHIVSILFAIGGMVLFLTSTILLIRLLRCREKGLIPHAPANICRCCYEPDAPFPGSVCRACLYVRTLGAVDEQYILDNYERQFSQQDLTS